MIKKKQSKCPVDKTLWSGVGAWPVPSLWSGWGLGCAIPVVR